MRLRQKWPPPLGCQPQCSRPRSLTVGVVCPPHGRTSTPVPFNPVWGLSPQPSVLAVLLGAPALPRAPVNPGFIYTAKPWSKTMESTRTHLLRERPRLMRQFALQYSLRFKLTRDCGGIFSCSTTNSFCQDTNP